MNLRARFALHAGLHAPDAGGSDMSERTCPGEQVEASTDPPGAARDLGEGPPVSARLTVAASPRATRDEPVASPDTPRDARAMSTPADASPGWSGAYARGVYRLFVRGRATRPSRPRVDPLPEPAGHGPIVPEVTPRHGECAAPMASVASVGSPSASCLAEPSPTREVVNQSRDTVEVRAPAPAVREVAVQMPVAPVIPTPARTVAVATPTHAVAVATPHAVAVATPARAVVVATPARAVAVATPVHAIAVATPARVAAGAPTRPESAVEVSAPREAAADPLALGPDVGGYVRRVIDWPLVPGARPALLGGALARLELPDAPRFCGLAPRLLAGVTPGAGGSPVVFLDLETTALDRGAGALAFMVGIAALVDGALRVEQWILTRLSSEAAMLTEVMRSIEALAGPGAVLSSFNGASFDLPLLRTRLRRAGLSATSLERPHLDLLPPARRMWRGRGPDCRLVTLERTQLAVRRVHDIAGHEIPAVFWAWLRRPNDPEVQAVMARVADHNLADLITLPALAAALCHCMTAPQDLDMAVRAAEHSRAAGRPAEALELLEAWYPRPAATAQRRRALLLTAELLRRDLASRTRAAELWAEVCRISPGDPAAHEALAKYLEHHAGDPARALEVARASASPCPRRLARLQRKLTGAADAARTPGPVAVAARSVPGPLRSGHLSC